MLRLLARRAAVQWPLLAAVVAVVTIGATLLGVCALLLTVSQDRALIEGMKRAAPPDVEVTTYVTGVPGKYVQSVADDTRTLVTQALGPYAAPAAVRASSMTRVLEGTGSDRRRVGYLSGIGGLADRARLTAGRWPQPAATQPAGTTAARPLETAVLESTARLLNLKPGSRVRLAAQAGFGQEAPPVSLVVVGIFQPLTGTGWDRDPLGATGYDPAFLDGGPRPVQAYGPFVVDLPALFASGSTIDRLQLTFEPNLSAPTAGGLNQVTTALVSADARLRLRLGERVKLERIATDLPFTLGLARAQQAVTRSTVLVVVLLGTALTAAALGLAGRLVAGLRADETALLSALGATRPQLIVVAVVEAAGLAAIAAALAVPLSGLAHAGLTHLPALAQAGLATSPTATGAQVSAVVLGAVLLAGVLVAPVVRPDPEPVTTSRGRLGLLARSGADLLLIGLAAVGWWQLRAQPTTQTGADTVRVLAPVLFLVAGAAVAPRLLTLPLRAAEGLARRSPALVLPLAAFEAARRPRAIAAGLLLALAASTAAFGLGFGATWEHSQRDQAAARVGTDLALTLAAPVEAGQAEAIAGATGGVISPVTDRGVVIGRWVGDDGAVPRIVAVDTRHASALLRGRLPAGKTWADVGSRLAPASTVGGLSGPGPDAALTLGGTSTVGPRMSVLPRLVLQERDGLRTSCTAAPVTLDGKPHPLRGCGSVPVGTRVVALSLRITFEDADPGVSGVVVAGESRLTIDLSRPGPAQVDGHPASTGEWTARSVGTEPQRLADSGAQVSSAAAATIVRATGRVNLSRLLPSDPVELVATAFRTPGPVPVAVSGRLSQALKVSPGDPLSLTVGGSLVPAVVTQMLPLVPSAPGEAAVLADVDLLSRALIAGGDLDPAVDAWWVGHPSRPAAAAGLALGRVETRADVTEQLSRGPLRVGLPAALIVLIPAAILLVLAGTIMHVTSDIEARAVEVARLRGLGVPRRSILGALLAQHGGVLVLLIGVGALVGALAAALIGPPLIRSDLGAAPVPAALVFWPWSSEAFLLAGLLLGGTVIVALVIVVQLRRADAAHLRVGA